MEATIKFTLPDEQVEFESAVNGEKLAVILFDIDQYLRAQTKCEGESKIDIDIKKDKTHVTISLRVTPWLKFV